MAFRRSLTPQESPGKKIDVAYALSWYELFKSRPGLDVRRYQLGPVCIVHLAGEPFVEYQSYAENLRPNDFLAVAGYGDGEPGYICMDKALTEGGYEPTESFVGPPNQARLKVALAELLQ